VIVVACQDAFVEVCGCRTRVRRGGKGAALLYLHGARGLPGWLPVLQMLSEKFDVIAPDHPGYGLSDTPPWLEDIPDLGFFYLEFAKALGLNNYHLVGHSMGAWIAMEMAIRSTQWMKTLTIISTGGLKVDGFKSPDVLSMDKAESLRHFFNDPKNVERELNRKLTPEQEAQLEKNLSSARHLAARFHFVNPSLRKWLCRVDVPTHIIWGDADRIQNPGLATVLNKDIPGSEITIIPGGGHMLHMEMPEPVAAAIAQFIS
jgi:pimeloyl-ACP methyl ester carboxylesterase